MSDRRGLNRLNLPPNKAFRPFEERSVCFGERMGDKFDKPAFAKSAPADSLAFSFFAGLPAEVSAKAGGQDYRKIVITI